jgi:hypothetical protein
MKADAIIPTHKAFIPEENRKQITPNNPRSRVASIYRSLRYFEIMTTKFNAVHTPITNRRIKESILVLL